MWWRCRDWQVAWQQTFGHLNGGLSNVLNEVIYMPLKRTLCFSADNGFYQTIIMASSSAVIFFKICFKKCLSGGKNPFLAIVFKSGKFCWMHPWFTLRSSSNFCKSILLRKILMQFQIWFAPLSPVQFHAFLPLWYIH